jgi:hypothetical protein
MRFKHPRIAVPGIVAERRHLPCANLGDVAVDDQDSHRSHVKSHRRQAR